MLTEEMRKLDDSMTWKSLVDWRVARKRSLSWGIDGGGTRRNRTKLGQPNRFYVIYGKMKRDERPNVGGVSIRSRNGAPSSRKGRVNGQMTKASSKGVRPSP